MELFDRDHPYPHRLGKVAVLAVIGRAADTDHADPVRVQQPLFHRAAKRRAMRIHRAAEIAVEQIGVAVEVDHPQGAPLCQRPQDRQGAEMIAPRRHRQYPLRPHAGIKRLHPREAVHQVRRVRPHVTQIGAVHQLERAYPGNAVLGADHGRGVAQLARPMAWPWPVRGATIPGRTDEANLHLPDPRILQRHMRQPHEGRHPGKPWQIKPRHRTKRFIDHNTPFLSHRTRDRPRPFHPNPPRAPRDSLFPTPIAAIHRQKTEHVNIWS
ncbi:hypothetical protein GALL_462340 [mine drainage metagenome]|uniref:Uncharacterized protein n=1 Tax=mine drainage metagenome TaxID=410659 RepID=A0A1J5Q872_9ZZZZ